MKKGLYFIPLLTSMLISCGGSGSNETEVTESNILDTTIEVNDQISVSTKLGETTVQTTGDKPTNIIIKNSLDEKGNTAIGIEISGGDAQIILPENPVARKSKKSKRVLYRDANSYPISETIDSYSSWFVSANANPFSAIGGIIPYLRGDRIVKARLYKNSIEHKEKSRIESAGFNLSWLEASRLMSVCNIDLASCGHQDKIPVLFIHGFQKETFTPDLDENGGSGYWGEFPNKLLDKGYVPFEFRWSSNARFEDVAHDLAKAIDTIYTSTGNKKVHIVAHSFGGLLLRTLLQVGPQKASPDYYHPSYSGVLIQNMLATATTVGSPHSGIADTQKQMHGFDFPQGQDVDGVDFFEGCQQLSCHLMGEDVLNSYLANILQVNDEAGEWAVKLNSTKTNLPHLNLQVLIGFGLTLNTDGNSANVLTSLKTAFGDLLISGYGQRFYPELALSGATEAWSPLLQERQLGNALVSEFILGQKYPSDNNNDFIQLLEPEMELNWSYSQPNDGTDAVTSFDINYVPFKHSSGAYGKNYSRWYSQEVCIGCDLEGSGYHDTLQRVFDWMKNKIECTAGEMVAYNEAGAAYCAEFIDPPINLKATLVDIGQAIQISWNAVDGASSYELLWSEKETPNSWNLVSDLTSTSYNHYFNDVRDTYSYKVIAISGDGKRSNGSAVIAFSPSSTESEVIHNGITYGIVVSPNTGKVWLDRNIGANRVCTNGSDNECFGGYFQWGRGTDGHENPNSLFTLSQATSINNTGDVFIFASSIFKFDWAFNIDEDGSIRSHNWKKIDGSSVCPVGFRVPSEEEFRSEIVGNYTFLNLPYPGIRYSFDRGQIVSSGEFGDYRTTNFTAGSHRSAIIRVSGSVIPENLGGNATNTYTVVYNSVSTGASLRCISD